MSAVRAAYNAAGGGVAMPCNPMAGAAPMHPLAHSACQGQGASSYMLSAPGAQAGPVVMPGQITTTYTTAGGVQIPTGAPVMGVGGLAPAGVGAQQQYPGWPPSAVGRNPTAESHLGLVGPPEVVPQPPAPPAPKRLTEGMPTPASVEQQKLAYARALESQLESGRTTIAEQTGQAKAILQQQAEEKKLQYALQIEEELMAQEMKLDEQTQGQVMYLHSTAFQQKSQLEHQAANLIFEYRHRQMQDQMEQKKYEMQMKQCEMRESMAKAFQDKVAGIGGSGGGGQGPAFPDFSGGAGPGAPLQAPTLSSQQQQNAPVPSQAISSGGKAQFQAVSSAGQAAAQVISSIGQASSLGQVPVQAVSSMGQAPMTQFPPQQYDQVPRTVIDGYNNSGSYSSPQYASGTYTSGNYGAQVHAQAVGSPAAQLTGGGSSAAYPGYAVPPTQYGTSPPTATAGGGGGPPATIITSATGSMGGAATSQTVGPDGVRQMVVHGH